MFVTLSLVFYHMDNLRRMHMLFPTINLRAKMLTYCYASFSVYSGTEKIKKSAVFKKIKYLNFQL